MIECQVCGKLCKRITASHLKTHGYDFEQYREEFPDAPLTSKATRRKHSKRNQESWARGERDHIIDSLVLGGMVARDEGRYDESMEALWAKTRQRWKDGHYNDTTLPALQKGYKDWIKHPDSHALLSRHVKERWKTGVFSIQANNSYQGIYRGHTFRSSYEFAALKFLLSRDISFLYEPFRVEYGDGRSYCPDFMLFSPAGILVVEVKPESQVQDFIESGKLQAMDDWCSRQKFPARFNIWTEPMLFEDKVHRNAIVEEAKRYSDLYRFVRKMLR